MGSLSVQVVGHLLPLRSLAIVICFSSLGSPLYFAGVVGVAHWTVAEYVGMTLPSCVDVVSAGYFFIVSPWWPPLAHRGANVSCIMHFFNPPLLL